MPSCSCSLILHLWTVLTGEGLVYSQSCFQNQSVGYFMKLVQLLVNGLPKEMACGRNQKSSRRISQPIAGETATLLLRCDLTPRLHWQSFHTITHRSRGSHLFTLNFPLRLSLTQLDDESWFTHLAWTARPGVQGGVRSAHFSPPPLRRSSHQARPKLVSSCLSSPWPPPFFLLSSASHHVIACTGTVAHTHGQTAPELPRIAPEVPRARHLPALSR